MCQSLFFNKIAPAALLHLQRKYYFWKGKFYKCKESIKFHANSYK